MNFNDKIKKVNDLLDEFGGDAIQEYDKSASKGFSSIGFKAQYIIDAMNEIFGADGWKHVVHTTEIREVSNKDGSKRLVAVADVSIQFISQDVNPGTVLFETGKQFGGGGVVGGAIADALKSAVTDGIGKCLSLLSVGNKAYRGTLVKEYKGKVDKIIETEDAIVEEMSASRFTPKNNGKSVGFKSKVEETKVEIKKDVLPPITPPVEPQKPVEAPKVTPPQTPMISPPKSFLQTPKVGFKETKSFKDYFKE